MWIRVSDRTPPDYDLCVVQDNDMNVDLAFYVGGRWRRWADPQPEIADWIPGWWMPLDLDVPNDAGPDDNYEPDDDDTEDALDYRMDSLTIRVNELARKLALLDQDREYAIQLRGRISSVETQVAQLNRVRDDLDRQSRGIRNVIDRVDGDVTSVQKSFKSLRDRVFALEMWRVAEHDRALHKRVAELEKQVAELNNRPVAQINVPPYVTPANPWDQHKVWCQDVKVSDYGPVGYWESAGGTTCGG